VPRPARLRARQLHADAPGLALRELTRREPFVKAVSGQGAERASTTSRYPITSR
jgi:hypothetical protein